MKTTKSFAVSALLTFVLIGCPRPPIGESESNDSDSNDPVARACADFCTRAVGCSVEVAEQWAFESQRECEDYCVDFTEFYSQPEERAHCEELLIEEWSCAAQIPTCEVFLEFEGSAFGADGPAMYPCKAEVGAVIDGLCT